MISVYGTSASVPTDWQLFKRAENGDVVVVGSYEDRYALTVSVMHLRQDLGLDEYSSAFTKLLELRRNAEAADAGEALRLTPPELEETLSGDLTARYGGTEPPHRRFQALMTMRRATIVTLYLEGIDHSEDELDRLALPIFESLQIE
jgi:hypothetical protein